MAAEARLMPADETLKKLDDVAKAQGDQFWVKVQRRTHLGTPPTVVATLSGAVQQHLTTPELWLPELCGGGKFFLTAAHESNPGQQIGGSLSFPIDTIDPRDVDVDAVKKPGWRGPANLEFPKRAEPRQSAADAPAMYGIHAPPGPGTGDSASRTQPETWARSPGGGVQRGQYGDDMSWRAQAQALETEKREIEKQRLENERTKHRDELEGQRKQHEAEMKALKAELMGEIRSAKPEGPNPMLEFMKMQSEERRAAEARAVEDRRAERERQDRLDARAAEDRRASELRAAEDRKAERERQDRADARFEKMLEKMSERKEKDPLETMKMAKDLLKGDNEGMMKTIHSMAEMTATVSGVAMDLVERAADAQMGGRGEEEPAWMKGVDKLVKGFTAFNRRPPPGQPFPQAPQPQQQVSQQGLPQQVQQQQPPHPMDPRAAPQQQPQHEPTILEQFELAVQRYEPVEAVADALVKWINDPSIQQALNDAGGDPEQAIYKRLGNWSNASDKNKHYFRALMVELEKRLQAAGHFGEDQPQGEEPAGEEDDGGDEPEGDEGGEE